MEGVGGLYDEEALEATGERASIDLFRLSGPFAIREVVQIAGDYPEREIAGRSGVIDGSFVEDEVGLLHGVWIEELGEGFALPAAARSSRRASAVHRLAQGGRVRQPG